MLPIPASPEAVSPSSEEELSISTLATVSSHPSTEGEEETGQASTGHTGSQSFQSTYFFTMKAPEIYHRLDK
jgi:hypothetical protein